MTAVLDRSERFAGTAEIRAEMRFDEDRLGHYLAEAVPGFAGPLTARQFKGGQSNPTYELTTPGGAYVLRRKPPGKTLPSAHAVDREHRVMTALGGAGFPVPRTRHLCLDEAVIGSPFYVMDKVEGRLHWDAAMPTLAASERPAHFKAMVETLARLHRLDPVALGLEDFGRPGNYIARQIGRWSRSYREDGIAGRVAEMDRLADWLPAHLPGGEEASIVHGDYRCDNVMFAHAEPRVVAVLDWELSTIGHPLADFTYHLMMYRMPPIGTTGLLGYDLAALNIPPEADTVRYYCAATGRETIADLDYYIAYNLYRLAAIVHGVKARMLRGNAVSAHAEAMAAALPELARLAWANAERV